MSLKLSRAIIYPHRTKTAGERNLLLFPKTRTETAKNMDTKQRTKELKRSVRLSLEIIKDNYNDLQKELMELEGELRGNKWINAIGAFPNEGMSQSIQNMQRAHEKLIEFFDTLCRTI
jgi:hypothetical protein